MLAHLFSVFAAAWTEFVGIPIPSSAVLLYVGALAGSGALKVVALVAAAAIGAVIADLMWYFVGRRHGDRLLNLYCTVTLGTEHCTEKTHDVYLKYGEYSLIFAKFIPGFSTFAAPMAGHTRTKLGRFVLWDGLGAMLWSSVFIGGGAVFGGPWVQKINEQIETFGTYATCVLIVLFVVYFVWKYWRYKATGRANAADLLASGPSDD